MADHLTEARLWAPVLAEDEEAHLAGCVRCRSERRVALAGYTGPGTGRTADVAEALANGRYRRLRILGSGGMATVYEVLDTTLHVHRAIKVLKNGIDPALGFRERFVREARTMVRLRHPNIVEVYDVETGVGEGDEDVIFIVMELLTGSLMDRVQRDGPLPVEEATRHIAAVLDALQLAHDNGVIHRDVKPQNILLDERGTPKLADFGIARVSEHTGQHTSGGALLGTLAYMAPEQRIGAEIDGRADVYAAGVTLYVLLTGRPPPELYAAEVWQEVTRELPANLATIIRKATRLKRDDRWATPRAMADALRGRGDGASLVDEAVTTPGRVPAPSSFGPPQPLAARPSNRVGIAVPALVLGAIAGVAIWRSQPSPAPPSAVPSPVARPVADKPSIAVLPFTNASDDKAADYLSDGLTEDIIAELTRFSQLRVAPRNSSFHYRPKSGESIDIAALTKELGVRYVLEGSVRRTGDQLRIVGELIDGETNRDVWAEHYDRTATDLLAVQDEVIRSVVGHIAANVVEADVVRATQKPTINLTAYDLTLVGRKHLQAITQPENELAREAYEQALVADPKCAEAWVGLGRVYYYGFSRDFGPLTGPPALEKSIADFNKAIALDPNQADTYAYLGAAEMRQHQYDQGAAHLKQALTMNPDSAEIRYYYGEGQFWMGDFPDAITQVKAALALDPFAGANWYMRLAWAEYFVGDYDAALTAANQGLKRSTTVARLYNVRAAIYAEQGKDDLAQADVAKAFAVDPKNSLAQVAATSPFRDHATLDRFLASLRKAGVGEGPASSP